MAIFGNTGLYDTMASLTLDADSSGAQQAAANIAALTIPSSPAQLFAASAAGSSRAANNIHTASTETRWARDVVPRWIGAADKPFNLFSLPAELRLMVFEELGGLVRTLPPQYNKDPRTRHTSIAAINTSIRHVPSLDVLRTSLDVAKEYHQVVKHQLTLVFDDHVRHPFQSPHFTDRRLATIEKLEFNMMIICDSNLHGSKQCKAAEEVRGTIKVVNSVMKSLEKITPRPPSPLQRELNAKMMRAIMGLTTFGEALASMGDNSVKTVVAPPALTLPPSKDNIQCVDKNFKRKFVINMALLWDTQEKVTRFPACPHKNDVIQELENLVTGTHIPEKVTVYRLYEIRDGATNWYQTCSVWATWDKDDGWKGNPEDPLEEKKKPNTTEESATEDVQMLDVENVEE